MLGGLSKLADRNFVTGFLLPALLGAAALIGLWGDPSDAPSRVALMLTSSSYKELTIAALAIWVASVLLFLLNLNIYKILEGYDFWPRSFKKSRKKIYKKKYKSIIDWLKINTEDRKYYKKLEARYVRYPVSGEPGGAKRLILSTKFGNAIRAFETYPLAVYRVSSIPVWLRLLAIIPKDYLSQIENSKADIDFFVNTMIIALICLLVSSLEFLFSIFAGISTAIGDYYFLGASAKIGIAIHEMKWSFLLSAGLSGMLAAATYYCAVQLVATWGGLVKSAFDLYLPDLAEKLGYRLPDTAEERGQFWEDVNAMFLFLRPIPDRWVSLQSPPARTWWHAPAAAAAGDNDEETESSVAAERKGGNDVQKSESSE